MGPTDEFELEARRRGYRCIAGMDEAGRGPLAGPVVASAVILPSRCRLVGVDDSKQVSESERARLYEIIVERARAVGIGVATEQEIDRLNILEATRLAMRRALASLTPPADCLLIDAVTLLDLAIPFRSIIKGDTLSISIAAASIVAKITRDRMMVAYHRAYPEYNFLSHKGYGTEEHLQRLAQHGPCAIHRRTFAPVAQLLSGQGGKVAPLTDRSGRTFTDDPVTVLDPRRLFGQEGESAAEQYLRRKGYRIVARNLRSSVGELDLVAEDGQVLVFVEVKARRTESFGGAIHAVHPRKQEKLIQLAAQYLARHHVKDRLCRFDVVLLQAKDGAAPQIEHIQNAFEVSGDDLRW